MADEPQEPTEASSEEKPAPAEASQQPAEVKAEAVSAPEKAEAGSKEESSKAPKAAKKKAKAAKKGDEEEAQEDPASLSLDAALPKPKIVKAKGSKNITQGIVHILATFNNTQVSITDMRGNVLSWSSSGKCGFRGSKKSTAYVAQVVAQDASRQAMAHGLKEVDVRMKGPGTGRESAVRALQAIGLEILSIRDVTPIPHNGCRLRKQRRV